MKKLENNNGRQEVKFLDYTIALTCDGWVITKPKGKLYECNLGNYSALNDAKAAAVIYFMLERPDIFAKNIFYKLVGHGGCMGEYRTLREVLKKEGIEMPVEITETKDMNSIILVNGMKLTHIFPNLRQFNSVTTRRGDVVWKNGMNQAEFVENKKGGWAIVEWQDLQRNFAVGIGVDPYQ